MSKSGGDYYHHTISPEITVYSMEKLKEQTQTGHGEALKKKNLLNYFRRIKKECRREISSENEDYKSSSTDLKRPERCQTSVQTNKTWKTKPLNRKVRSFKIIQQTMPVERNKRIKKKLTPVEIDCKTINNRNQSCRCSLPARKKCYAENICYTSENQRNKYNDDPEDSKILCKNVYCHYSKSPPILCERSSKGWIGTRANLVQLTNPEIKSSPANRLITGNTSKMLKENIDKHVSGSSLTEQVDTIHKNFYLQLKYDSDTTNSNKKNKHHRFFDRLTSGRTILNEKMNVCPNTESECKSDKSSPKQRDTNGQFVDKPETFKKALHESKKINFIPVKDDLDSTEILYYEGLLRKQENKRECRYDCPGKKGKLNVSVPYAIHSSGNSLFSSKSPHKSSATKKRTIDNPKHKIEFLEGQSSTANKSAKCQREKKVLAFVEKIHSPRNRTFLSVNKEKKNILRKVEGVTCKNTTDVSRESRGSEKLCKLVNTCRPREWLGCFCEAEEKEKSANCSEYCASPKNVDNGDRPEHYSRWRGFHKTTGTSRCDNENRTDHTSISQTTRNSKKEKIFEDDHTRTSFKSNLCENPERFVCRNWKQPRRQRAYREMTEICSSGEKGNVENDETYPKISRQPRNSNWKVTYDTPGKLIGKNLFNRTKNFRLGNITTDMSPLYCRITECGKLENKFTNEGKKAAKYSEYPLRDSRKEKTTARTRGELIRSRITKVHPSDKEFSFGIQTPSKQLKSNLDSRELRNNTKEPDRNFKVLLGVPPSSYQFDPPSFSRTLEQNAIYNLEADKREADTTCCCSSISYSTDDDPVNKLESSSQKVKAVNSHVTFDSSFSSHRKKNNEDFLCCDKLNSKSNRDNSIGEERRKEEFVKEKLRLGPTRVRIVKPRGSYGKTNLKKILIYPPSGERGPPLTLYKNASNIKCKVKGDVFTGFRYNVTYVQKFVSPIWHPNGDVENVSPEVKECIYTSDYG